MELRLDNSKRKEFVACPAKYYYQYERGVTGIWGSTALRYGSCWHAAMEHFYGHIKKHGWTRDGVAITAAVTAMQQKWEEESEKAMFYEDYRTLENCLTSFLAYVNEYSADEGFLKVIKPERAFRIKVNMSVKIVKMFPYLAGIDLFFTGIIDLVAKLDGRPWQMEHKTTGSSLYQQKNRLHRLPQIIGYTIAEEAMAEAEIDGSLISLHHLSARKSTAQGKEGTYGKPKIEFARSPQVFTKTDKANWLLSYLSTANDIMRAKDKEQWIQQMDSCYTYGTCTYCNLCEQGKDVTSDRLIFGESYKDKEELWDPSREVDKTYELDADTFLKI